MLVRPKAYVGAAIGLWALVMMVIVIEAVRGWRFLFGLEGELETLGNTPNREAAVGDHLHIVAAHLKVGHSVHSPELYSCNIICLGCFLLSGCTTKSLSEDQNPGYWIVREWE